MTPDQRRQLVRELATELVTAAMRNAVYKAGAGGAQNLLLDRPEVEPLTDEQFATLACDIRHAAKRATVTVTIPDDALGGEVSEHSQEHPEEHQTRHAAQNGAPADQALERLRAWHADGCPAELAATEAYADLDIDEHPAPLTHDIGALLTLAALAREHQAGRHGVRIDELIADRDRARDAAVALEQQNAALGELALEAADALQQLSLACLGDEHDDAYGHSVTLLDKLVRLTEPARVDAAEQLDATQPGDDG